SHYLNSYSNDDLKNKLIQLSDKLIKAYQIHKTNDWHWFEEKLTYDNAILPMALLKAYEITGDFIYKEIGLESLSFLDKETLDKGYYSPIGNDGWFYKG